MESADLDSEVPTGLDAFNILQGHLKSYPTDSWTEFFTEHNFNIQKASPQNAKTKNLWSSKLWFHV